VRSAEALAMIAIALVLVVCILLNLPGNDEPGRWWDA
jgi:hypothetical protein